MLDDAVHLIGLAGGAKGEFLGNNDVSVHVGVDDMAVLVPPHRPLDPHQAVLLQMVGDESALSQSV